MASSPTSRTLDWLRSDGYLAAVVEKWNPHARIRNDLFGFIDILAIKDGETVAVQATSWSNMSARIKKIAESEHIGQVRRAGWTVWVIGWKKGSDGRWTHKLVDVS